MALELQYGKDKDMHIKRAAFDENAANYDRVRPRYCPALFEEIFAAAEVNETTRHRPGHRCIFAKGLPGNGGGTWRKFGGFFTAKI